MSSIKSTLPSFAADDRSTIYQVRRDRQLSVDELSRRSGVPADVLRQCERKAMLPGDEYLVAIAGALDCKVSVLLGMKPFVSRKRPPTVPSPVNPPAIPPSPEFIELTQRVIAAYS
jgi:hypothetical protein